MASPLLQVAGIINSAMSFLFLDARLDRDTPLETDPITFTVQSYPCRAIVENYDIRLRADGTIKENERQVMILANGIAVMPQAGDRVTVSGVTFTVLDVSTDPATAVWTCKGRM